MLTLLMDRNGTCRSVLLCYYLYGYFADFETSTIVARHNSERYSATKVFIAIAYLLEILGLDFGLARILTTLLLDLPNSRTQELEGLRLEFPNELGFDIRCMTADKIGLKLCARACYDPRSAPEYATSFINVLEYVTSPLTQDVCANESSRTVPETIQIKLPLLASYIRATNPRSYHPIMSVDVR